MFSNGIIALALRRPRPRDRFGADVTQLIPFYAIGVFTSFTLSQAGMAKRHLRIKEQGWQLGLLINGLGAIATGVVLIVIGITKFTHGAWAVVVLVPVMVWLLVRMNRQYEREQHELERDLERFDADELRRPTTVLLVETSTRRRSTRSSTRRRSVRSEILRGPHRGRPDDDARARDGVGRRRAERHPAEDPARATATPGADWRGSSAACRPTGT